MWKLRFPRVKKWEVILALILGMICAILIVPNAPSRRLEKVILYAFKYEGTPSLWYTPEELNITDIKEHRNTTGSTYLLAFNVPEEYANKLQQERPVFKYKDEFYQIFGGWVTVYDRDYYWLLLLPLLIICLGVTMFSHKKVASTLIIALIVFSLFSIISHPTYSSGGKLITLAAFKYQHQPNEWYTPEQLNISQIEEHFDANGEIAFLYINVPKNCYKYLLEHQPIFKYNQQFFQIFNGWVTESCEVLDETEGVNGTTINENLFSVTHKNVEEIDDEEGPNALYALVFVDEEERSWKHLYKNELFTWDTWATLHIERGDEYLVEQFGIDLRILGFIEWNTPDDLTSMYDILDNLIEISQGYSGWIEGQKWSHFIDVIIGITNQGHVDKIIGLACGRYILCDWGPVWRNDNLVQHEVSHLFEAPDHTDPCCAMASHTHINTIIIEDGECWIGLWEIPCALTSYHWCECCYNTISAKKYKFRDWEVKIEWSACVKFNPFKIYYSPILTEPYAGTYFVHNGKTLTVKVRQWHGLDFCSFSVTTYREDLGYECFFITQDSITVTGDREWKIKAIYLLVATPQGGSGGGGAG